MIWSGYCLIFWEGGCNVVYGGIFVWCAVHVFAVGDTYYLERRQRGKKGQYNRDSVE